MDEKSTSITTSLANNMLTNVNTASCQNTNNNLINTNDNILTPQIEDPSLCASQELNKNRSTNNVSTINPSAVTLNNNDQLDMSNLEETRLNGVQSSLQKNNLCQSLVDNCIKMTLKNYKYCYKHILEDSNSPFQQCCFVSVDNKQCVNPAPKLDKFADPAFCVLHMKADQSMKTKNKKKKKKKEQPVTKTSNVVANINQRKRPSSLPIHESTTKHQKAESSSAEEEFSFFTDTVHLKKTECTWLGNQASDADSTDSEDENPLNHAGSWTLVEALKIYKEKMTRLRFLYGQQFKRMHYCLKEERRKLVNENDMEPFVLSKISFHEHTDDPYKDYLEDVYLSNYQRFDGEEIIAEKMMREKRSRGTTLSARRTDLPKCHFNMDGMRCTNRVMPFSKFCLNHILQDPDQYLYSPCSDSKSECTKPGNLLNNTCSQHITLIPRPSEKCWENFISSKKARETRKRKVESEIDKDLLKPTRVSARLNDSKRKSSELSPVSSITTKLEQTMATKVVKHNTDCISESPKTGNTNRSVKVTENLFNKPQDFTSSILTENKNVNPDVMLLKTADLHVKNVENTEKPLKSEVEPSTNIISTDTANNISCYSDTDITLKRQGENTSDNKDSSENIIKLDEQQSVSDIIQPSPVMESTDIDRKCNENKLVAISNAEPDVDHRDT